MLVLLYNRCSGSSAVHTLSAPALLFLVAQSEYSSFGSVGRIETLMKKYIGASWYSREWVFVWIGCAEQPRAGNKAKT